MNNKIDHNNALQPSTIADTKKLDLEANISPEQKPTELTRRRFCQQILAALTAAAVAPNLTTCVSTRGYPQNIKLPNHLQNISEIHKKSILLGQRFSHLQKRVINSPTPKTIPERAEQILKFSQETFTHACPIEQTFPQKIINYLLQNQFPKTQKEIHVLGSLFNKLTHQHEAGQINPKYVTAAIKFLAKHRDQQFKAAHPLSFHAELLDNNSSTLNNLHRQNILYQFQKGLHLTPNHLNQQNFAHSGELSWIMVTMAKLKIPFTQKPLKITGKNKLPNQMGPIEMINLANQYCQEITTNANKYTECGVHAIHGAITLLGAYESELKKTNPQLYQQLRQNILTAIESAYKEAASIDTQSTKQTHHKLRWNICSHLVESLFDPTAGKIFTLNGQEITPTDFLKSQKSTVLHQALTFDPFTDPTHRLVPPPKVPHNNPTQALAVIIQLSLNKKGFTEQLERGLSRYYGYVNKALPMAHNAHGMQRLLAIIK